MRTVSLNKKQVDNLDPRTVVVVIFAGGDDVLAQNGAEIIADAKEEQTENYALSNAIEEYLKDIRSDSFEILVISDGIIKNLKIKE